jgi:hypothetical protein
MSEGIVIKSDGNKTLAQIQAEVAAFEANPVAPGAPEVSTPPTVNAVAAVAPQEKAALPTPEQTPPAEEKAPDQQPKETTVKAPAETVQAAEPVKETNWKAAYEGLQRKYNKTFIEKKAETQTGEEVRLPEPYSNEGPGTITPEFRKRIQEDLEKDPVDALIKLNLAIIRKEIQPVASRLEAADFEKQEEAKLAGLDKLANEGHDWLKTEDGLRKMDAVLSENPELWKTKDPYRAALGFIQDIPLKAGQRGQAQATGLTPILGAGSALPPVVSAPAVSKVDKLQGLLSEMNKHLSRGDVMSAQKIQAQMDEIDRG